MPWGKERNEKKEKRNQKSNQRKKKIAKRKGAWGGVQERPDTNFWFSLSRGIIQTVHNSPSNNVWQYIHGAANQGSSSLAVQDFCRGLVMEAWSASVTDLSYSVFGPDALGPKPLGIQKQVLTMHHIVNINYLVWPRASDTQILLAGKTSQGLKGYPPGSG